MLDYKLFGSFSVKLAVRAWIMGSAWLCGTGWILSVLHQLNRAGYAVMLLAFVAALFFLREGNPLRAILKGAQRLGRKSRCRFSRLAPLLFLALAFVSLISGLLVCPQNGDTNSYRIPRVLHWVGHAGWYWIRTDDPRMNISGCVYEWLVTPLILFTRTDRWVFLPNVLSYLLLPGLIFSVLRRMQVRPRVAWWWMWFLSSGWCFVQQACSTTNDSLGAVYALAAVDFALRARESRKAEDLWLSLLAAGLLTGLKPTNLPLLLPWLIAVWPSVRLLLTRWMMSCAIAGFSLLVSAAPMAGLNWIHTGSWKGYSPGVAEQMGTWGTHLELNSPFWGIVGNIFCLTTQNLLPPFFPWAKAWNEAMQHFLQTPLGAHFTSFEVFGRLNRAPTEGSAGIGLGVFLVTLVSLWSARRPGITSPPDGKSGPLLGWLRWSPWLALLVFMAKVGVYENARYAASYYVLLFPLLLVRPGQVALVRRHWWQRLVWSVMLFTVVWMTFIRGRQLVPATVVAGLHANHPQNKFLAVLNDYYLCNLSAAAMRDFTRQRVPAGEAVVGYATHCGGCEPGMWLPLGWRRVERVLPGDGAVWFRSQGIHYVFVDSDALNSANETIETWMQRQPGSLVDKLAITINSDLPPAHLYLVHLSSPAEALPPL